MHRSRIMAAAVICILAFASIGMPESANADGSDLLKSCKVVIRVDEGYGKADYFAGECLGYITAVRHFNDFVKNAMNLAVDEGAIGAVYQGFCLPTGVQNGQLVRVFVKYLEDHPEKLHRPKIVIATAAFVETFPCDMRDAEGYN